MAEIVVLTFLMHRIFFSTCIVRGGPLAEASELLQPYKASFGWAL